METLLSEMKNDVHRLPGELSRVQAVSGRLGMSERALLERLRNPSSTDSSYPPFHQMTPGSYFFGMPIEEKEEPNADDFIEETEDTEVSNTTPPLVEAN